MSYTIKWEEGGVYCKFTGAVTLDEILKGALVATDKENCNQINRYITTSVGELNSPWDFCLFKCIEDARIWVSLKS